MRAGSTGRAGRLTPRRRATPSQREGGLKSDQCGGAGIVGMAVALEGPRASTKIVHGLKENDRPAGMGQHRPGQDPPHTSPDNGHIVCRFNSPPCHSHALALSEDLLWLFQT